MSLGGAIASMFVEIGVKTDARAFDSLKLKIAAVSTALVALGRSLANEGGKLDRLKTITGIKKETIDSVRQLGIEAGISEREVDGLMETFAEMKHKATSYLHEQNIGLMGSGFQIGRGTKVTQILSHVLSVIAKIREEYGKIPEIGEQKAFEFLTVPMGLSSEQAYALMNMQEKLANLGGEMPKPRITEDMAESWQDLNVQMSIFMGHLNSIKQKFLQVVGVTEVLKTINNLLKSFNEWLLAVYNNPVLGTILRILSALLAIGVAVKAIMAIGAIFGLGKAILAIWKGLLLIKAVVVVLGGLVTAFGASGAIAFIVTSLPFILATITAIIGLLTAIDALLKKIFGFSLGTFVLASIKKLADLIPDALKKPFIAVLSWIDSVFGTSIVKTISTSLSDAEKEFDNKIAIFDEKVKNFILSIVNFAKDQWNKLFEFIFNQIEGIKDTLRYLGILKDDKSKKEKEVPITHKKITPQSTEWAQSIKGWISSVATGRVLGWGVKDSGAYSLLAQLMKGYYSRQGATIQSNDNSTNTYNVTVASKEEAVEVVEAVRASNSSPAKKVTGQKDLIGKTGAELASLLGDIPWEELNN